MRRTTSDLWVGRGLRKLDCAKRGFLSSEYEILQWKEVDNTCVVCQKPSTLTVQWQGPGEEKPRRGDGAKHELQELYYRPVKVMDAYICGICRVTCLPRLIILTQWDLRGTRLEPAECTCQWDGRFLHYCNQCVLQSRCGRLLQVGSAKGWQVRRYIDPLKALTPDNGGWAPPPTATPAAIPTTPDSEDGRPPRPETPGPSAPSLYPEMVAAEPVDYSTGRRVGGRKTSDLEEAVRHGWPYDPSYVQMAHPPLATYQVPLVLRVFRDPAMPGYTSGMDQLPDDVRELAQAEGWEGPWELTTWGKLIEEVINSEHVPLEDLADVPREEGARGTRLYYYTTGLDAWGHPGAKAKMKRVACYVTPEGWMRNGVTQVPGGLASRTDTPVRPDQTVKVQITVQMVVVPYKGVYSVGADVVVIEESPEPQPSEPEAEEETPAKRFKAWVRRRWETRKSSRRQ
ncbi:uncharacterized protein V6R79_020085 [Siganus canaliculatus]